MEEILDDGNDGKPEFLTPALPRSFASHSRIERILTLHSKSLENQEYMNISRIYQEYILLRYIYWTLPGNITYHSEA